MSVVNGGGPGIVELHFCPECNNMMYPKQDKVRKILMYACRLCKFTEVAESNCVHVNKEFQEIDELKLISDDVISDPTLARTEKHPCPVCSHQEAVFFQAQARRSEDDMRLYYVCTNRMCCHKWTQ